MLIKNNLKLFYNKFYNNLKKEYLKSKYNFITRYSNNCLPNLNLKFIYKCKHVDDSLVMGWLLYKITGYFPKIEYSKHWKRVSVFIFKKFSVYDLKHLKYFFYEKRSVRLSKYYKDNKTSYLDIEENVYFYKKSIKNTFFCRFKGKIKQDYFEWLFSDLGVKKLKFICIIEFNFFNKALSKIMCINILKSLGYLKILRKYFPYKYTNKTFFDF